MALHMDHSCSGPVARELLTVVAEKIYARALTGQNQFLPAGQNGQMESDQVWSINNFNSAGSFKSSGLVSGTEPYLNLANLEESVGIENRLDSVLL